MNTTIIFDLETGGLELHHPIIQIAAVAAYDDGSIVDAFQCKVQFLEEDADPVALKINHYDPQVWAKEAKELATALSGFSKFLEPFKYIQHTSAKGSPYSVARLAAYNAEFDAPRLKKAFKDTGKFLPADPRVLCILQLAMWSSFPGTGQLPSFKLADVATRMGIPVEGAHDALADCKIAAQVMANLLEVD